MLESPLQLPSAVTQALKYAPGGQDIIARLSSSSAGRDISKIASSIPGGGDLAKIASAIPGGSDISKLVNSVPGADKILGQLSSSFPSLPIDPNVILKLIDGKVDVEGLVKSGVSTALTVIVPGIGPIAGIAADKVVDLIEDAGKAIIGAITGQPQKKKRRQEKWSAINHAFDRFVQENPLLIFDGKQAPSSKFISKYRQYLLNPIAWKGISKDPVPTWLTSTGKGHGIEHDYDDSGISRPGKTYLDAALNPKKIAPMLKKFLDSPSGKEAIQRELEKVARLMVAKTQQLKRQEEANRAYANAAASKRKVATSVSANNPKSEAAKEVKSKIDKKTKELKKSSKQRTDKAKKAKVQTERLKDQVNELKKKLREKPDDKLLQSQAKLITQQAQNTAVAAASNATLAILDQTQATLTQAISNAISSGNPAKAQQLTSAYNALNMQRENLRSKLQLAINLKKKELEQKMLASKRV